MSPLPDANRTGKLWLAAILLGGFLLLAWVPCHSRAKLESWSAGVPAIITQNPNTFELPTTGAASGESQAPTALCVPFIDVVPSQDGTELFISIGRLDESCGTVCLNPGERPGTQPPYARQCCTVAPCFTTLPGLTPGMDEYVSLSITSTLGLDMVVELVRAYVPASTSRRVNTADGNLQLTVVTTDTITFDTYVALTTNHCPPGPAPLGDRFVGNTYSVRAAGALLVADKPMSLRLYYNDVTPAGADPHTLAIFAWDAYHQRWDDLGGWLFYDQGYLALATSRFTTYALMTTPSWRDEFADNSGLDLKEPDNVTLIGLPDDRALVLENAPGSGSAISRPITSTAAVAGWDSLTFTRTIDPPTTALTVDVLSTDGTELLTDVASKVSLAGLDPAQYPALKLRANLSSTVAGETPALDQWKLTWRVEEHKVYVPLVLK